MTIPRPEAGLVIRYSYLWAHERNAGREEGTKDRPCAILLTILKVEGDTEVLVVPVTTVAPRDKEKALELPPAIKRLLGLDDRRSWAICSESNFFTWPGPDLRPLARDGSVAYGVLPPRFFAELKQRFLVVETAAKRVRRTE